MEDTIKKLDSIFLFMFGLGLAGVCVGLAAICGYNRTEKFWGSFTLCSAVVCVFGFLMRSITGADKTDSEKAERLRRRAEAEGEYKAFCLENGLGDRWVDCGGKRIWMNGDTLIIAEGRDIYLKKRENSDGEITCETILPSDLSYYDLDRGRNTVIRYNNGSAIKYLDFKETLNKSSAAERRIFCPIRAVLKMGNTYSIPSFSELSAESKSSAVSSCRFNHRFLKGRAVYDFLLETIPEKERKE